MLIQVKMCAKMLERFRVPLKMKKSALRGARTQLYYSSMNSITSLTLQCRSLQSWFRVFVDMLLPLLME